MPRHSNIDLSGLVAIILFLLVFFMMGGSAPQTHHGSGVDLVQATRSTPQPGASKEDALNLWVRRDDTIYFGNSKFDIGQIPELIKSAVRQGSEAKVYLHVDARAKYGAVNTLLNQIRIARIERIALITN